MTTYTLMNDQTGETLETLDAQGFARWLAVDDLLEALEEASRLLSGCALNAERLGQRFFASQILTALSACREAVANAKPDAKPG